MNNTNDQDVKIVDSTFKNRDILKWMNRMERGKLFVDKADEIITKIGDVLTNDLKQWFIELYKDKNDGVPPEGVICDVSIKPPIAKKILPEGESHPIVWKDYPIYFYMGVNARFTIKATNENMVNSPSYYSEWYNTILGIEVEQRLRDAIKAVLNDTVYGGTDGVFNFPIKSNEFKENKINIFPSSSLSVSQKGGAMTRSGTAPFITSEDYREMLVTETSIALGRIIPEDASTDEPSCC